MIEPEIAFEVLEADAQLAEVFLKFIFRTLLDVRMVELAFFEKFVDKDCVTRLSKMIESKFARLDYTDAIKELEKSGQKFEFPVKWGIDLQSEHEKYLTDVVVKSPVAVINYPRDIKAFYMRQNDDGKTVAAMDVLAPGIGEIIGGSQREERLDVLDSRIDQMGLNKADYGWYRDLRRYGTVPHAGFGLGFERAIIYATGIENIRDVIAFPRAPRQVDF
jgi:asparaginyl-tRNA synthetase